jgi:hypothetical protein
MREVGWVRAECGCLFSAVRNLSDTVNNYNVDISYTQCCLEGLIAAEEISCLGGIIILYCPALQGLMRTVKNVIRDC